MSASLAGSSICDSETRTSGGTFLLSFTYCSNWATTARTSASVSRTSPSASVRTSAWTWKKRGIVDEALDPGAGVALDQHLHRAVGQLQQLQDAGDRADAVDVVAAGIVLARVLLRHQQDLLVVLHHLLERVDRLLAPDEQGHDHVREDDDVPQRQHRETRCSAECSVIYPRHAARRCRSDRADSSRPTDSGGAHPPRFKQRRPRQPRVPQRPIRTPRRPCGRRRS